MIRAKSRSRSPGSVTTPWTAVALFPSVSSAASNWALSRPVINTRAPSSTNFRAVARPTLPTASVTPATFPSNPFISAPHLPPDCHVTDLLRGPLSGPHRTEPNRAAFARARPGPVRWLRERRARTICHIDLGRLARREKDDHVAPNRCLDLGHAAVDEQLDPGDETAVVGGEEQGGLRHLIRRAHPAQRHGGDDVRLHLVDLLPRPPGFVEAWRFGRAGADGVHADLAVPQLRRPAARERPHGGLAGAVDAARFHPLNRRDRGIQDDRPAGREERQRLLHGEEQPLDVDGEELVEVLLADRPERGQRQEAGVGEQDVEAALLPLHGRQQPVQIRRVGDVARHAGDVLADLPDRFVQLLLAASGDEDVGALGDEPPGGGQADAAVAPGDDRDFPYLLLRHGTAPLPVSAVRVTGDEHMRPPHHTVTTTLPICWFDSR